MAAMRCADRCGCGCASVEVEVCVEMLANAALLLFSSLPLCLFTVHNYGVSLRSVCSALSRRVSKHAARVDGQDTNESGPVQRRTLEVVGGAAREDEEGREKREDSRLLT